MTGMATSLQNRKKRKRKSRHMMHVTVWSPGQTAVKQQNIPIIRISTDFLYQGYYEIISQVFW